MLLKEIVQQLIAPINAGSASVDMKWVPRQVEDLVPSLRQEAMEIKYNGGIVNGRRMAGNFRINGDWTQKYAVPIDQTIQEADLEYLRVVEAAPAVISLKCNGDVYLGEKNKTNEFSKCTTRDELATLKKRGFVNNGKNIIYFYSGSEYEIYGDKMLQSFWRESVLADPMEKPGFNPETDKYPISQDLLPIMIDIFKQKMGIAIQQPKDPVLDQTVTPEAGAIKANLR